jgi:hypothetical protein
MPPPRQQQQQHTLQPTAPQVAAVPRSANPLGQSTVLLGNNNQPANVSSLNNRAANPYAIQTSQPLSSSSLLNPSLVIPEARESIELTRLRDMLLDEHVYRTTLFGKVFVIALQQEGPKLFFNILKHKQQQSHIKADKVRAGGYKIASSTQDDLLTYFVCCSF